MFHQGAIVAEKEDEIVVTEEEINAQIEEWRRSAERKNRAFLASYAAIRKLILTINMTDEEVENYIRAELERENAYFSQSSMRDKFTVDVFTRMIDQNVNQILKLIEQTPDTESNLYDVFESLFNHERLNMESLISQQSEPDQSLLRVFVNVKSVQFFIDLRKNISSVLLRIKPSGEDQDQDRKDEREAAISAVKVKKIAENFIKKVNDLTKPPEA